MATLYLYYAKVAWITAEKEPDFEEGLRVQIKWDWLHQCFVLYCNSHGTSQTLLGLGSAKLEQRATDKPILNYKSNNIKELMTFLADNFEVVKDQKDDRIAFE